MKTYFNKNKLITYISRFNFFFQKKTWHLKLLPYFILFIFQTNYLKNNSFREQLFKLKIPLNKKTFSSKKKRGCFFLLFSLNNKYNKRKKFPLKKLQIFISLRYTNTQK